MEKQYCNSAFISFALLILASQSKILFWMVANVCSRFKEGSSLEKNNLLS